MDLSDEQIAAVEKAVRAALQPITMYDAVNDVVRPVTQADVDRFSRIAQAFAEIGGSVIRLRDDLKSAG